MSTIGTSLSSIFNSLTASGVTSSVAGSVISALSGNYKLKATLNALVTSAVANQSNAAAVSKIAMEIETTPGAPTAVIGLAGALTSAQGIVAFMQVIEQLETEIGKL